MSRRAIATAICVVLALGACGTAEDDEASGPASPDGPTNAARTIDETDAEDANVPRAPTTTSKKPRNKVRPQPDCRAYYQFSFINAMVALAKEDKREAIIMRLQVSANKMKEAAPQFAEKVDRVYALNVKSASEGLTPEERAEFRALLDEFGAWNQTTCIIEPGSPEYDS